MLEKIDGKPEDRPKANVVPFPGVKGGPCGFADRSFSRLFFLPAGADPPPGTVGHCSLWERSMHIMEGFLPVEHALGWTVASAPFVAYGLWVVKKRIREHPEQRMLLGVAASNAWA